MARINTVVETPAVDEAQNEGATITAPSAASSFEMFEDVPLPAGTRSGGKSKYPWAELKAGGSFFVPAGKVETFYTLCSMATKKHPGFKFIARKWTCKEGVQGVMVWKQAKAGQ